MGNLFGYKVVYFNSTNSVQTFQKAGIKEVDPPPELQSVNRIFYELNRWKI